MLMAPKLIVAGILTAAGCWIRWVAVKINPPSYAVMMIGQVIASIGSPLTLNIMTKVNILNPYPCILER